MRSQLLGEPDTIQLWRTRRFEEVATLPSSQKYGIGIFGLFPESLPAYDAEVSYHVDASKGMEVYTWKEAMLHEELSPIVSGIFESTVFPKSQDQFHAASSAHFKTGLVLYVQPTVTPDGSVVREHFVLDTLLTEHSSADMLIVIVKEGARLDMVSRVSGGGESSIHERHTVVVLRDGAELSISFLDTLSSGAYLSDTATTVVSQHAFVKVSHGVVGEAFTKRHSAIHLIGAYAEARVKQGAVLSGRAILDMETTVHHCATDTRGAVSIIGILGDQSRALVRTGLRMPKALERLSGSELLSFFTLSKQAKIDTIPALDIETNDVSASHCMSISHVRREDTFYAETRGISGKAAQELFLEGQIAGVFSVEDDESVISLLQDAIHHIPQSHEQ
jgi:Fe-S cluster assembly scaffold protein SufB